MTEKPFAEVRQLLEEKKLLLRSGTLVDATIIPAPPLTENAVRALTMLALSDLYLA